MSYPQVIFARIRPDTWGHLATAASLIVGVLVLGTAGYTILGLGLVDAASRFHTDDVTGRPFAEGDVIVAIGTDEALDRLAQRVSY